MLPTPRRQPVHSVPFTQVAIDDPFWSPRQATNRAVTVRTSLDRLRETGSLDAFRLDWNVDVPLRRDNFPDGASWSLVWRDSDVAKAIEAAAYTLMLGDDPALTAELEAIASMIASAAGPDGYLNTYFRVVGEERRFTNLRDNHELYCAGHLIEAAIAHHAATGSRTLLDAMLRYADLIARTFGPNEGQIRCADGHPEIELALMRLADHTGDTRWRDLARFFVDVRGQQPQEYDAEARRRGEEPRAWHHAHAGIADPHSYQQAHCPLRDQDRIVGHAVRALYLYAGATDVAIATGDGSLVDTMRRLWRQVTQEHLYLIGGIGDERRNEGVTVPFALPNREAYCETCAAVALVFWAQRMLRLDRDAAIADVMERTLYNNVLAGVTLDGKAFTYANTLAADADNDWHHHAAWYGCSCCPPNVCRLLASLGGYVAQEINASLTLHLYVGGTITAAGLRLRIISGLPWHGTVTIAVEAAPPTPVSVHLRLPGWSRTTTLALNDREHHPAVERGYAHLDRIWRVGDTVTLSLHVDAQRIYADPRVAADRGRVALQRGPLVYCIESCDHAVDLDTVILPRDATLHSEHRPDLLDGTAVITATALAEHAELGALYRTTAPERRQVTLTAIPYCRWDNRTRGSMRVWLREA